ncbi:hypothetical protein J2W28_000229 [Variovorax boronicumulans]|uniref:hypothetical protein n=1 Tax=Variovorax boronicumulans TaxID=436515 RepID=UPI002788B4F5|nr:hypothetical protein [Variovorax boronicumulans]MDP9990388.1 hypothetical protein [Variovorax boronicumulans]MDQ0001101.1 hypothetical protein [Variovorax boronicumulans]
MNVLAINAMLGGPGLVAYLGEGARFLVYGGVQPGEGGAATTLLAAAVLALPAGAVDNGRLSLVQADTAGDLAVATGIATWGRIELAAGVWVADFSMSGPSGSGQVKLVVQNPPEGDPEAKLYQGGTFFIGEVVIGG